MWEGDEANRSSFARLPALDGVRGLAALSVMAYHYHLFRLGWAGVDVFFVLSGFVITRRLMALRGHPRAMRTFYLRRAARIWPLAALLLGIYTIGLIAAGRVPFLEARWWGQLTMLSSWSTSLIADKTWPRWVFYGFILWWSLSVEEWAYLLWAPLVLAVRRKRSIAILVGILIAGPVLRFAGYDGVRWVYAWFPGRLDAIGWGAIIAIYPLDRWWRTHVLVLGSLCVVMLAIWHHPVGRMVVGHTAGAVGTAGAIGWLTQHPNSLIAQRLAWHRLTRIGTLSYGIYLLHYPIWGICFALPIGVRVLVAGSLTFAAAAVSWRCLEQPVTVAARGYALPPEPRLAIQAS